MSLNVTIPDTFNGPLGLLHSLIVRDEIDIYDIPIAKLTASYCEEIEKMEVINIDEGAEFLDLASRLKEIKLRMLLPPEEALDGEEDDDDDAFDPRSSLVEALLEYRRFKDAAKILDELADEQSRRHPRIAPKMQFRFVEADDTHDSDSLSLFMAMQNMLARMSAPEIIESHEIPVSTRIEQIQEVLRQRERTRFSLLLSTRPNRNEMVAFFVALLELIRRGLATARQADNYSDIIIEMRQRQTQDSGHMHHRRHPRSRPGKCFPEAVFLRRAGGTAVKVGAPISIRTVPALFPCSVAAAVSHRRKIQHRGVVAALFGPIQRQRTRSGEA